MNKRKVLSILLLALITVTLAVSCSGSIDAPAQDAEELAYVTFGNGHSRGLSTSYETKAYGTLYWFYTAQKTDSYGTTGQVGLNTEGLPTAAVSKGDNNAPAKGLSGQVGPFSQGAWKFKLYAYAENATSTGPDKTNLIYASEEVAVILKGGDVKNVPVSVSLQGNYGKVSISNVKFYWAENGGSGSPQASLHFVGSDSSNNFTVTAQSLDYVSAEGTERAYFKLNVSEIPCGDGNETTNIRADYYTVEAKVYLPNSDDAPLVTQTFGLRVYGNTTTVITGDLTEGLDSYVLFDVAKQDMKVFVPSSTGTTKIENINVVPDTTTVTDVTKSTTVEFDEGALTSVADKTLQLDVKVTTVEAANNKFNISGTTIDNKSAFAGIDVTLWATDSTGSSEVNSFTEGKYATVTTYIAKGLTGVAVKYNGTDKEQPIATANTGVGVDTTIADILTSDTGTALGYNPSTGLLRFKTNHFSEYYVLADCVAVNVSTNVGYSNLQQAFADVVDGQIIRLVRSITVTDQLVINKSITFDLNSFTLTSEKPFVDQSGDPRFAVVVNSNTTIKNGSIFSKYSRSIISHADMSLINVDVSTEGSGNAGVNVGSYGGNLYVEGGTYTGDYAIGSFAADHSVIIKGVTTHGVVYHNGSYRNLTMVIENSTITGRSADDSCGVYISGSKTHGTLHDVTISNSTISGSTAIEVKFTNLILNNCNVTATGELSYKKNNNGSTTSGFAVISADNSMNDETASLNGTITINGGTYTGNISLSTSGLATTDPEASYVITGGTFTDLASALEYAASGACIKLGSGRVTLKNEAFVNKTITIIGSEDDTVLDLGISSGLNYQNGATLTFKDMTIKGQPSGNFGGLAHTVKVSFENCKIEGKITLYSKTDFTDCVFNNQKDYAVWTWGGDIVNFNGCTFNSGGKALLLYGGAGSKESPTTTLNVTGCTFNSNGTLASDKAAIEIGNDYNATYILNVSNVTVNGFAVNPEGTSTGSVIWGNKNSMDGNHLVVTIDGTQVYPKSN